MAYTEAKLHYDNELITQEELEAILEDADFPYDVIDAYEGFIMFNPIDHNLLAAHQSYAEPISELTRRIGALEDQKLNKIN